MCDLPKWCGTLGIWDPGDFSMTWGRLVLSWRTTNAGPNQTTRSWNNAFLLKKLITSENKIKYVRIQFYQ